MKKILLFSILSYFLFSFCSAQIISEKSPWNIETSLTFPINRIYMVNMAYSFKDKNEILFGYAFQNWKNVSAKPMGQAHANTITIGYRYYFWRGLNSELMLFPAYNKFESFVDNKSYSGFEIWSEYRLGYKFDVNTNLCNFYINIQPGVGHAIYMQNIWPGLNKNAFRKESLSFIPQIAIGFKI
jgi:hypothetical protein